MEKGGSCTPLLLQLRAGCTAPPPTPVRRAEPPDLISCHRHPDDDCPGASGLSSAFGDEVYVNVNGDDDDDGAKCSNSKARHQNAATPSRADLDELASYLMKQSFVSTPTLLSPPSMRRKPKASVCSDEIAIDQSRHEERNPQSLVALSGGGLSVYRFCTEGFFKESETDIRSACEDEGALYVRNTDIGKASFIQIDHVFKLCSTAHDKCLIGSLSPVSLSQLMPCDHSQEVVDISSHQQEESSFEFAPNLSSLLQDTLPTEAATDFRNTLKTLAKLMAEISEKLLKILLGGLCGETRTNLQGGYLKPVLYIYKGGGDEIVRCVNDVILSILSPGDPGCQVYNERELLLVVLGSYIQVIDCLQASCIVLKI